MKKTKRKYARKSSEAPKIEPFFIDEHAREQLDGEESRKLKIAAFEKWCGENPIGAKIATRRLKTAAELQASPNETPEAHLKFEVLTVKRCMEEAGEQIAELATQVIGRPQTDSGRETIQLARETLAMAKAQLELLGKLAELDDNAFAEIKGQEIDTPF
jgi:hypothetical protein